MPVYNENPAGTFAALLAMAEALVERDATGFEIFVLSDTTRPEHLRQGDGGVSRAAREARRPDARVVPAPLRQRRPQGRQPAGLRHALGRPLRLHDRARRGQHPRARHARHARARDGGRSESRHPADRAAARGRQDAVRAVAAIRGPRVRTRSSRAASRAGRATTATTGATTRSSACARSRRRRVAGAARQEAVRRRDPVARLRRGRAAAPRRLVGAHAADARRQLGGQPAVAARRRGARPALGAGQHPASRGHPEPGFTLVEPRCTWGSAS